MEPVWEQITATVDRLPVPGGWLYRYAGYSETCVVFVPNPACLGGQHVAFDIAPAPQAMYE